MREDFPRYLGVVDRDPAVGRGPAGGAALPEEIATGGLDPGGGALRFGAASVVGLLFWLAGRSWTRLLLRSAAREPAAVGAAVVLDVLAALLSAGR